MRALTLLAVGCLAGGVAAYALRAGDGSVDASPSWLDRIAAPFATRVEPGAAPGFTSRLAAFRAAAAVADAALLEATLERLVREVPDELNELEMDAALARFAELDPERAAEAAVRLDVADRFVVRTFQSWARSDFDAAARRAVTLDARSLRSAALLGLLYVTSEPESRVPRVMALLSAAEGESFFVDWLVRLADDDPGRAFREALVLGDADTHERAILRIAEVWARRGPVAALSQAESLPGGFRTEFRAIVIGEWARRDPGSLLDYLSSLPRASSPDSLELASTGQWLPAADPARTIEVARGMSNDYAEALRRLAYRELIRRDPDAALIEIRAMPPGRERDEVLRELALGYGRNPDALARLESLSVASESVRMSALLGTVLADPSQLRDVLERLPAGQDPDTILINLPLGSGAAEPAVVADVLLGWDDPRAGTAVGRFLSIWLRDDSDPAVDWAIANRARLDPRMLSSVAQTVASRDARAAAAQVERLPAELRDEWIAAIVPQYVRSEPRAALEWLTQFRGQSVYEGSLRQIAARAADRDPRTLARLVAEASGDLQVEAAAAVVGALSTLDEAEAVRWAQGLSDGRARQQAILTLIPRLARSNVAEARRLVEVHIVDPADRQRALAIVDRAAGR